MYLSRFSPLWISEKDKRWTKTDEERAYLHHGIPRNFWKSRPVDPFVTLDSPIFEKIKTLDEDDQAEYWNVVKSNIGSKLLVVGSLPTDDAALSTAFWLMKHELKKGHQAYAVDIHNPYAPSDDFDMLVLYNIIGESATVEQLAILRGCLYGYSGVCRVVVVAGDPFHFMLQRLRMRVNGVFYHYDQKVVEI